jgi:hypothetical protein
MIQIELEIVCMTSRVVDWRKGIGLFVREAKVQCVCVCRGGWGGDMGRISGWLNACLVIRHTWRPRLFVFFF